MEENSKWRRLIVGALSSVNHNIVMQHFDIHTAPKKNAVFALYLFHQCRKQISYGLA